MFVSKLFDRLRKEKPDFMIKIKIIEGDLGQPSLGLSSDDREWLIKNVNFVFHCAATVKFNETLQIATEINIQGTNSILDFATMMKNLKVNNISYFITVNNSSNLLKQNNYNDM